MQRISYAMGDAGFNLLWVLFDSFLLYYFAEVFRLPAWALAPVLIAGRCADIISGLVSGIWADRIRSRFGVYRPVILWTAFPLGLCMVALFTGPETWPAGLTRGLGASSLARAAVCWALLTSLFFAALYSASNVAYTALLSVVTPNEEGRVRYASTRFVAAAAAVSAAQFFTLPAVSRLGQGNAAVGWQRVAILYASAACSLLLWCFAGTKEMSGANSLSSESIAHELSRLARHSEMGWLLLAMVSSLAAFTCRGTATPFFIKYNTGHPAWISAGLISNSFPALMSCLLVSMLPRQWLPPRRLGSFCATLGMLFCMLPIFWKFIPISRLILLQGFFGACTGMLVPAIFALFAEFSAVIEGITGRRVAGLVAAVSLFGLKSGAMLGSALIAALLAHLDFHPGNSEDAAVLQGIRFLFTLAPASFLLVAFTALRFSGSNRSTD